MYLVYKKRAAKGCPDGYSVHVEVVQSERRPGAGPRQRIVGHLAVYRPCEVATEAGRRAFWQRVARGFGRLLLPAKDEAALIKSLARRVPLPAPPALWPPGCRGR